MRRLTALWALLAVLVNVVVSTTTNASAGSFVYDAATTAQVDARGDGGGIAELMPVDVAREQSAPPLMEAPRTSTTQHSRSVATEAAGDWAESSGILRDAARGKGNFGLGESTEEIANRTGQAWVGDGATVASDGTTLVSSDGLRQYRPPSFKPNLGLTQANFESRWVASGRWQTNGHLTIVVPP